MNYTKASTEIDGDLVRKRQPHELVVIEAAKTRAAALVAAEHGGFRVPRVVDVNPGELVLAFVADLIPIRTAGEATFAGAGVALAHLHQEFRIPQDLHRRVALAGTADVAPPVVVHGDFTVENVMMVKGTGELVILDWSVAMWLGPAGTLAAPHLDLGAFITSCFWNRIGERGAVSAPERKAAVFLSAYRQAWDQPLPSLRAAIEVYSEAVIAVHKLRLGRAIFWRYWPSIRRMSAFIKTL